MIQHSLSIGLLAFCTYLATILLLLRTLKISAVIIVCGSALFVYLGALMFIGINQWAINFFSFSASYWFLTLSLLMVFGAVLKSISLRMMLHLLNQSGWTDSYDKILKEYIKDQSYTDRVKILIKNNMIETCESNAYSLTKKGRFFANIVGSIQQIFYIKTSG